MSRKVKGPFVSLDRQWDSTLLEGQNLSVLLTTNFDWIFHECFFE